MNLDEIKRRLRTRVQAFNGIPNPEQMHEAVISAIDALSEKAPTLKKTTIDIVTNTAEYNLPADFQTLSEIDLVSQTNGYMSGNVLMSPSSMEETIRIINGQLVFSPTPTTNRTVTMYYYAKYVPTGDSYNLTQDQVTALLYHAIATVTRMKADKAAEQAWVEQDDNKRVDMSKRYAAFQQEANEADTQWRHATMSLVSQSTGSPYGTRALYVTNPYDPWAGRLLEGDTY